MIKTFEIHLIGTVNETYERYIFYQRSQKAGEMLSLMWQLWKQKQKRLTLRLPRRNAHQSPHCIWHSKLRHKEQSYLKRNISLLRHTKEEVKNPKTQEYLHTKFVVVDNDVTPVLCLNTAQQLRFLKFEENNFERVSKIFNSTAFDEEIGAFQNKN